ncbi:hypothetical protein SEA_ANAMIKA_90 [Gordonia phage Anamika]|uniref:Uncharacterized protein n=1 Tax=Gordonia phage Anamika TaxID=2047829 RepID=A0A2H4PG71_9CAUD|nr:hypothetical protein SEA_ANAMIKA_90 [Gordonia phage Anamika]
MATMHQTPLHVWHADALNRLTTEVARIDANQARPLHGDFRLHADPFARTPHSGMWVNVDRMDPETGEWEDVGVRSVMCFRADTRSADRLRRVALELFERIEVLERVTHFERTELAGRVEEV